MKLNRLIGFRHWIDLFIPNTYWKQANQASVDISQLYESNCNAL